MADELTIHEEHFYVTTQEYIVYIVYNQRMKSVPYDLKLKDPRG